MRTLDPEDWAYNGYYDNSNDSTDMKLAQGWNYHQGPVRNKKKVLNQTLIFTMLLNIYYCCSLQEWVWPTGFFLLARLHYAPLIGGDSELQRTIQSTEAILSRHLTEASTNYWRGLPELTNKDGDYCKDSCRTQAWSASTILEVLIIIIFFSN